MAMHERKGFWDKNAGRYDRFMRKDRTAYEKMYEPVSYTHLTLPTNSRV